ncbi:MAG: glycosyltransferase family 4 protein [Spirochaetales bacterium]
MHIAFIVTRADSIGGAQIHVRDMAFRLIREGHSVSVLTGSEGPLTDILKDAGIEVRILSSLVRPIHLVKDALAILETRKHLAELKPDLVSTHTAKAGMVGRIASWSLEIPSIFTVHGWQFAEGIPFIQRLVVETLERITARMCQKIITVSEYDRDLAIRRKVVPAEKLVTIYNGMPDVSTDLIRPFPALATAPHPPHPPVFEERQYPSKPSAELIHSIPLSHVAPQSKATQPSQIAPKPGASPSSQEATVKPVRLIMVARLQAQKDHPTLFRALSSLKDLEWQLELVGDGPDSNTLQTLAGELGISERVHFAGQRLDVPQRLREADIFVLATHWEGFPRSILEAMRAGLPVIATDVGGCRESVVEGKTGFLVPKEDPEALRERLKTLILNGELRVAMGREGRRRFEENFTFENMYICTLAVYREILETP